MSRAPFFVTIIVGPLVTAFTTPVVLAAVGDITRMAASGAQG